VYSKLRSAFQSRVYAGDTRAVAHPFVAALSDDVHVVDDDGHHLARVRRLEPGEHVTAADGTGAWRAYVVEDVGRGSVTLRAVAPPAREPVLVPRLRVAFALTKGEKPETVVRQLTELGVDAVAPVLAARSVVKARGDRATALVERLRRVAREAACQSRRARITDVEDVRPLGDLLHDGAFEGGGVVVAERDGPSDDGLPGPTVPEADWTLVVGPEGGFGPDEAAALAGVARIGVGPYVLRAETAAVAAAAVLTARRRPATA
jgi:16S rRNA (uracil1498-N3)-methyltransferase